MLLICMQKVSMGFSRALNVLEVGVFVPFRGISIPSKSR